MNSLYQKMMIAGIEHMLAESRAASEYNNKVLKGRAREIFVSNLLRPYLHPTLGICSGIVIDSYGKHSRQVDVIIFDKTVIAPWMLQETEGVVPCESVVATVEVKSCLTRYELKRIIQNALSVKALKPHYQEINPGPQFKNSTECYVFAFNQSTRKHLNNDTACYWRNILGIHMGRKKTNDTVPIDGLCVDGTVFLHCDDNACVTPHYNICKSHKDHEGIMRFVVHLVDRTNRLSLQRNRIVLSNYLL